jgi:hypothetical protein
MRSSAGVMSLPHLAPPLECRLYFAAGRVRRRGPMGAPPPGHSADVRRRLRAAPVGRRPPSMMRAAAAVVAPPPQRAAVEFMGRQFGHSSPASISASLICSFLMLARTRLWSPLSLSGERVDNMLE